MGCGASAESKYIAPPESRPTNPPVRQRSATLARERRGSKLRFDVFISHHSESQAVVERVNDHLKENGYRTFLDRNVLAEATTPAIKSAMADSASVLIFLSQKYFADAECCLELCEAVDVGASASVLFVVVDGATWGTRTFPDLSDVPEEVSLPTSGGGESAAPLKPRTAAEVAFARAQRLEHSRSYFSVFLDELRACIGPPPTAEKDLYGESQKCWQAAGGGVQLTWGALRPAIAAACAFDADKFARAAPLLAAALGSADRLDEGSEISCAVFGALFGGAPMAETVEGMLARSELQKVLQEGVGGEKEAAAGDEDEEESPVSVVVMLDEAGATADGGLTLVGPKTTLADVRAHLREEHADEEDDEPAAKLLAAGAFAFVRDGGASVKVEEEGEVKARELGDPITVKTTRAAD